MASFPLSSSWSEAGMGNVAPQPGSPILVYKGSGTCSASSQDNSPLAPRLLETAYLAQEEGGTMGSLVLQGQHPHFLLSQVRMRAQSQTLRGSASSAWKAGGMVGAAPLHLTQNPEQIRDIVIAGFCPPEALNWELGTYIVQSH